MSRLRKWNDLEQNHQALELRMRVPNEGKITMDPLLERMKLMDALDRYELEFEGMLEIQALDLGARLVVEGRRRDLKNRIAVIEYCLEYPSAPRAEC